MQEGAVCPHCDEQILIPRTAARSSFRKCDRCGRGLPRSAAFCMRCGAKAARGRGTASSRVKTRSPLKVDRLALRERAGEVMLAHKDYLAQQKKTVFAWFIIVAATMFFAGRMLGPVFLPGRRDTPRFDEPVACSPAYDTENSSGLLEPVPLPTASDGISARALARPSVRAPIAQERRHRPVQTGEGDRDKVHPEDAEDAMNSAAGATDIQPDVNKQRVRMHPSGVRIIPEDRSVASAARPRPWLDRALRDLPVATDERPRPAGIDFRNSAPAMDAYLAKQPEGALRTERKRAAIVTQGKRHLVHLMNRIPYEDYEKGIRRGSGRRIKGTVSFCSEDTLTVNAKGNFIEIAWSDMPFDQIVDFFTFYICKRLSYEGTLVWHPGLPPRTLIEAPVHKDAASDLLLLAVLCDWYGHTAEAADFAEAARTHDPGVDIEQYIALPGRHDP